MADKHEVEFEGHKFELRTGKINGFVMAQFLEAMNNTDPDAQVTPEVLMPVLRASIVKDQWHRFAAVAAEVDEDDQSFWDKAWETIIVPRMKGPVEAETGHPTSLPSVSTDGPEATPPKSVSGSDARVIELSHGRVDRLHMLREAQDEAKKRQSA